jgi:hypothetical protein
MTDTKETRSDRYDQKRDIRSTARDEATSVADDAKQAGGRVADTAKAGASRVADETKWQARRLANEATEELREQASVQQQRVASGLRSAGDELRGMAQSSSGQTLASDVVRQAAERATSAASWLENRDPGSLLEEVKQFARRRPGPFIAIAIGAGIVAGRLTRALAESSGGDSGTSGAHAATTGSRAGGSMTGDTMSGDTFAAGSPSMGTTPVSSTTPRATSARSTTAGSTTAGDTTAGDTTMGLP